MSIVPFHILLGNFTFEMMGVLWPCWLIRSWARSSSMHKLAMYVHLEKLVFGLLDGPTLVDCIVPLCVGNGLSWDWVGACLAY